MMHGTYNFKHFTGCKMYCSFSEATLFFGDSYVFGTFEE
jgi:hypothetical protein